MNFDYVWRKLSTQSVLKTPYYGVRVDRLKHPQGHELDYYVIEFARQGAKVVVNDVGGAVDGTGTNQSVAETVVTTPYWATTYPPVAEPCSF